MLTDEPAGPIDPPARVGSSIDAPAAIQPHGLLFVLREADLTIEQVSDNIGTLIGIAASAICGEPIGTLMDKSDAQTFTTRLRGSQLIGANPHRLELVGDAGKRFLFECTAQRRAHGRLIVELEPFSDSNELPIYLNIQLPIERLATAPDTATMLKWAADDIREISGFDRVTIARLESDWQSDIIAESVAHGRQTLYVGHHFPAGDLPATLRASLMRSPVWVIPDTTYVPARLVSGQRNAAEPVDLSRAILRAAPPDELEHLRNMGTQAAVFISIIIYGRLWGLIVGHHETPHLLGYAKRARCELMAHMLGWRLGARLDVEHEQRRVRESALAFEIESQIAAHEDLVSALIGSTAPLLELFGADGLAICIGERFGGSGSAPSDAVSVNAIAAAMFNRTPPGEVVTTHELALVVPKLSTPAPAGALGIRLGEGEHEFLFVFRPEVVRTLVWGGRGAAPRSETVRNQSRRWTADDISAAEMLGKRIVGRLQHLTRTRAELITHVNADLQQRNAQAEALIKLQDDVAAALPSRSAVVDVVLSFAEHQTRADGSSLEILENGEITFEAATGILAPQLGRRIPRAGTLSALSADLRTALVCNDPMTELKTVELETCQRMKIGSLLVVPIALSETRRVVLKVVSERRWAFSDEDTQALKLAATNLLSALRAVQKFTALAAAELEQRTYARQLRALHAIASTTTSHRKDQIDAALHLGLEQLGLDWAFLGVIDYMTQEFVIESSVCDDGPLVVPNGTRMPLGESILGRVALSKGVTIVEDIATLSERPIYTGWNAYISVPLFIGGANYGAIGFTSREIRSEPFSGANIEFLAVAGELIASAIERGLQREQLEKSQLRYRALTEAIPQMMWVIDAANQYEYVNERWTNYTGLSLEQSRAVGREGIFFADDFIAAGLSGPLPPVEFDSEVRLRRADGDYRWHLVRSVPFRGIAGTVDKWLVTATDIEARKAAETVLADVHDAALAATEAKSRFLATMSHEIRTPMNGVIGMTELLLLTSLNDEQREYTEVIRDSGQSLLRVLNDILDYSKIEAGKLELETVQFDLPGQMESVVELLRPGFTGKGVALTTYIAPDVRTGVVGDPGRLRQILLNLAGNALKFTATGGSVQIVITTSPSDDDVSPVRFTIKDTGIGIPTDVLDRLFQPFSQGDESTTRKYGGTGLGLSISAELVALMGGIIGVESVPDVGSEFWFAIPFRLAPNSQKVADARERRPKRSEPAPLRPERILLVEDNEINTFLALKQLQRLGFAVTAVTNGRQAVETVGRERYDLVFMDCHMPEMDGFEATRAIRRLETVSAPHLPIVAMTADARDEDHQNCLLAGMDDYISKPTNLDSLKAVLDRWLPAPERRRSTRNGTSPLSSVPTLGMAMLLELFNGDRAAVLNLLVAALSSINADLKRIEVAALERDFDALVEAAHRIKGTSGSIRAGRLVEISTAIESEARTGPVVISSTLLAELRAAVTAVSAEIQQQKKSADPATLR